MPKFWKHEGEPEVDIFWSYRKNDKPWANLIPGKPGKDKPMVDIFLNLTSKYQLLVDFLWRWVSSTVNQDETLPRTVRVRPCSGPWMR
jgi:hypothetical protein